MPTSNAGMQVQLRETASLHETSHWGIASEAEAGTFCQEPCFGKRRANIRQLAALEERIATNMARFERLVETLEAWSSCPQSLQQEQQQLQDASEPWLASKSRDSLPETESIGSQEAASDFTMAPCTPPSRAELGNGRLSESSPMQKDESFSFGCPQ